MDAAKLLDDLSVRIYEPPLSEYRDDGRICDTSNPLSVVLLLIDYEAECSINGISGFLGNSAGSRLLETIFAVRQIGCIDHANTLEQIRETATSAGMTYDAIQVDRVGLAEFSVTSFAKLHGDKWDNARARVRSLHDKVDWESFWPATLEFVRNNADAISRQTTLQ